MDMTQPATAPAFELVPLTRIRPSRTNPRKHFDQAQLDELTDSIRRHGVLQPVLVRPFGFRIVEDPDGIMPFKIRNMNGINDPIVTTAKDAAEAETKLQQLYDKHGQYELIAGERRFRAAQAAQIPAIPATIREMTDLEALELQVIENLQRADLHPMEEAEGYEQLMHLHHLTADDLAAKVGKSKAYVYARLKLRALCGPVREAFFEDKISASIALLIARIPVPELQKNALKEILQNLYSGPMSYRQARDHIEQCYMLRLKDAPFPTDDANVLPAAGPCGACPKRTGNQPELFADVTGADVCTDPKCFAAKRDAWSAHLRAVAEADGRKVITGKEAQKIMPYGDSVRGGYIALDDKCWDDKKHRTYRKVLGNEMPEPTLVQSPHDGTIVEVLPEKTVTQILRDKGIKVETNTFSAQQRDAEKKAKLEREIRMRIFDSIRVAAMDRKLGHDDWVLIVHEFFRSTWHEGRKQIAKVWGWPNDKEGDEDPIASLPDRDLRRMLFDLSLIGDTFCNAYSTNSEPEKLNAAAARYGIDADAIRKEVIVEHKAADAEKKKRKQKAAAKKKPAPKKSRSSKEAA